MQNVAPQSESRQQATPRSSDRVLAVLKAVASSGHGLSLTEVASRLGLAPSTALRQLRSLEAAELLVRGEDQAYRPGPDLLRIAHQVLGGSSMAELARPLLEAVAADSEESAYLAVPDTEGSCVYVATVEGPRQLRHAGWLGRQIPTASTAVGAALRGDVDDDGAAYRADGHEEGVSAVSAPVYDARGSIVAAISAVGPTFRLVGDARAGARTAVVAAAASLTHALGG
ncbi:MAG: IclR family transcriptional regulator C-terminal domain-containing protein [Thermoanaerobaculia bacterium]|nr:IclR family transcriptional regulator C-terminal domain-containing protein [Thermoanaerobaculia bacterium]